MKVKTIADFDLMEFIRIRLTDFENQRCTRLMDEVAAQDAQSAFVAANMNRPFVLKEELSRTYVTNPIKCSSRLKHGGN